MVAGLRGLVPRREGPELAVAQGELPAQVLAQVGEAVHARQVVQDLKK